MSNLTVIKNEILKYFKNSNKKIFKQPQMTKIEKFVFSPTKFVKYFKQELSNTPDTLSKIENIEKYIKGSPPTKILHGIYKAFQFGDFLTSKILDKLSTRKFIDIKQGNKIDTFFEKTFDIPQYFGGIRDDYKIIKNNNKNIRFSGLGIISRLIEKFNISKPENIINSIKDYNVLGGFVDEIIPKIFINFFKFKDIRELASLETEKSLKNLKALILNLKPEWSEKEVVLRDLRELSIDSIEVKNFKKTVTSSFEFSIILIGMNNNIRSSIVKNFNGMMEMLNIEGKWKASSFNFTEL